MNKITFDQVFLTWLNNENTSVEGRGYLHVAKERGFNSVAEWRLNTALRMKADTKEWYEVAIDNPAKFLPEIIIGPYKGWSIHFDNQLQTSFKQALEMDRFFEWTKDHNRIPDIAKNFPAETTIILYKKPDGKYIHIEGGHRICAYAYAQKIGQPVQTKVTALVADITDEGVENLKQFLKQGTDRQ
jgi:hypothetical protein